MRRLRVVAIDDVAEGVKSFTLVSPDGTALEPWTPGAHLDVMLAGGELRQYSLCSDPDDLGHYRIAVLRVALPGGRGGSCWLHDHVAVGDELEVGAPRNAFRLPQASRYLLLAGGIGITPLASMAHALQRRGAEWRLVYGARARAAMALADELQSLAPACVELVAQDERGLPVLEELLTDEPGLAVMCCGPAPMLDAVAAHCEGWSAASVHVERFAAAAAGAEEDAFEVELARSGLHLRVERGQTLLEALRLAGVDHPCSCEQGICGTCEAVVLSGAVDHRDQLLTDDERATNALMMVCVSRAAGSELVLDL